MSKLLVITIAVLIGLKSYAQPLDKKLHFVVGGGIGVVANLTARNPKIGLIRGIVVGTAIGIAKEGYDKYTGRGTVELNDALVTAAGAIVCSYVTYQIRKKFKHKRSRL